jgi:hypothetical protein
MGRLQNVQLHVHRARGHNVIVAMRDSGELKAQLESALFGED